MKTLLAGLVASLLSACGGATQAQVAAPPPAPPTPIAQDPEPAAKEPPAPHPDDDLIYCVEETNRYRATLHKKPYTRATALEPYAAAGAKEDAGVHQPHHHFSTGRFPGSYSGLAENELPWWSFSRYGSVREVMKAGIASMWAEGPGGGHYENIIGDYTEMGCGIYQNSDEITVVQDFRQP